MCYSMSNKVVHAFQELQDHHCGEANIWSVLLQILVQRAGVTRQNKEKKNGDQYPGGLSLAVQSQCWLISLLILLHP